MPSSGYRKTTADFGQMANDLQSAARSFGQMTSAAGAFASLVNTFAEFENRIIRVNALAGGTTKNLKELSDAARNIALTTKYSASEAAEAMALLAQAGFSTKETIEAIPAVLKLAQASMEDINMVSDMVSSTLKTFNLDVDDTARVVNVFAAANANSLASVNKLAFSMRQVGPVASEFGLSLEETTAALSVLYDRGLRGEQAGTALRNIIVRLIKPTQDLSEVFDSLGLAMRDERGAYTLQQLLGQLRQAGVTDEQLTKMFGREALAGAKTLIAATSGEWDNMTEKITGTDEATRQAAEQLESLKNRLNEAKNAFDELMISMGETVAPAIKDLAEMLRQAALWLRNLDEDSKKNIVSVLKWTTALLGIKAAFTGVFSILSKVKTGYVTMTAAIKGTRDLLTSLPKHFNETIRLHEIGAAKGTDWYIRMNEYYKSLHNGENISLKNANAIKNLTEKQLALRKATEASSSAWRVFANDFKKWAISAAGVTALLSGIGLVLQGLSEGWSTKQLTQEEKDNMFPELAALRSQIKETEKLATDSLPRIVEKVKASYKDIADLQGAKGSMEKSPYGLLDEAVRGWSSRRAAGTSGILQEFLEDSLDTGKIPTKESIAKKLDELGLPRELAGALQEAVKKARVEHANDWVGATSGAAADAVKQVFLVEYQAYLDSLSEVRTAIEDARDTQENAIRDIFKNWYSVEKLLIKDPVKTSPEDKNAIIRAWVYASTGIIIPEEKDVVNYIKENESILKTLQLTMSSPYMFNKSLELLKTADNDIPITYNIDAVVDIKADPKAVKNVKEGLEKNLRETSAIIAQQVANKNLRISYENLINDFVKKWGIVNQEIYAKTQVTALDLQQEKLKNDTYNNQVKLLSEIYRMSGMANELNTETTKLYLTQNGVLSDINRDKLKGVLDKIKTIDEEARGVSLEQLELAKGLVDQLFLEGKISEEKHRQLDQEKSLYDITEGNLTNLQKYREALDTIIANRDKLADRGYTLENFEEGLGTGILSLKKELDSLYDMGKNGMQGFADYMTDSMNSVVDNWGKGWNSMRDALKNTLTDMLKDLSHYFMKQAVYGLLGSAFSDMGASVFTSASGAPSSIPPVPSLKPYSVRAEKGSAWINGMQTFANGGVVTSPTLFNHRGGKGLMGEAGPEAIMPLRRDSQGRLGVSVAGGSTLNYAPSFNINMTTGQTDVETSQRNTNRMTKELDNKVKSAVLLVLAKEKRPGGLLYGG